jgi:hypothetical protein
MIWPTDRRLPQLEKPPSGGWRLAAALGSQSIRKVAGKTVLIGTAKPESLSPIGLKKIDTLIANR